MAALHTEQAHLTSMPTNTQMFYHSTEGVNNLQLWKRRDIYHTAQGSRILVNFNLLLVCRNKAEKAKCTHCVCSLNKFGAKSQHSGCNSPQLFHQGQGKCWGLQSPPSTQSQDSSRCPRPLPPGQAVGPWLQGCPHYCLGHSQEGRQCLLGLC